MLRWAINNICWANVTKTLCCAISATRKKGGTTDHFHNINGLKTEDLHIKMAAQVDGDNWKIGHIHHFYFFPDSSRTQGGRGPKIVITLEANPTRNQLGNGLLKIGDEIFSWRDLESVVKDEKFPESRKKYLATPINENRFERKLLHAHVLLDYEIARRKPMTNSDGFYPLTRSQVKKGIDAAVGNADQGYPKKVGFKIQFVILQLTYIKQYLNL